MPDRVNPMRYPVVVVGGLGAPRLAARLYGRSFAHRGFAVYTAPQTFLARGDVREAARSLELFVERVCASADAERLHLVGMSLGGLIALYYVKRGGGAARVDRLLAVGAPLNGSPLADLVCAVPAGLVPALRQARTDSDVVRELQELPLPASVRLLCLGAEGDAVTPPESREIDGAEVRQTPFGVFPVGHWTLFAHPGNVRAAVDLLAGP